MIASGVDRWQRQITDETGGVIHRADLRPHGGDQRYPYLKTSYKDGETGKISARRGDVFDPVTHSFISEPLLQERSGFYTQVSLASGRTPNELWRDSLTLQGAWNIPRILRCIESGGEIGRGFSLAGYWKNDRYVEIQRVTIQRR